jgi:neutral ceramidase
MQKTITRFLVLAVFAVAAETALASRQDGGWKAGVARVNITPLESMWMAGYAARNHPSEGKLHDLWAKALVLEDSSGNLAVLVTMDLVGIRQELSNRIRDALHAKYGLSRDQIILNSSHTHTGPETNASRYKFQLDAVQLRKIENYAERLEKLIINAVEAALKSRQPVQLSSANGVTRFQVNRRNNNEATLDRQTRLNGPNDFAVPVIKVTDQAGELVAIVFGYACHPTVLSDYNWSGDYAGFAQLELERMFPGTTALFFQGAGADQNPLPRRSAALALQYGRELAAAVAAVLEENMRPLRANLTTAYSETNLTFAKPVPTQKDLVSIIEAASGYPDYLKQHAKVLLEKLKKGETLMSSYPYPVQVWKVGEQMVVSLGGEVVIDYAITLKRIFGYDIFVLGYSNDVMAYIPSARIITEGGYEGSRSAVFTTPWHPDIETKIISEVIRLADEVKAPRVGKSSE